MTGVREYFSELSESGTDVEVVLGDDRVQTSLESDRCSLCARDEEEPHICLNFEGQRI